MAEPINALFGAAAARDGAAGSVVALSKDEKVAIYAALDPFIHDLCGDDRLSPLAMMDLVVGALHNAFAPFFWTGFYRRIGAAELEVGPSQGTLGCSHIAFGRGVCGTVAVQQQTRIVDDVHAEPNHIACDSASRSEIVVPVFVGDRLAAVLDVDSTLPAAFSDMDQVYLEQICAKVGSALARRDLRGVIAFED